MKKYIGKIAVFAMIVIFPFVSWYYLSGGYEYRKSAIKALESKEVFSTDTSTIRLLKDHVTLIVNSDKKEVVKLIFNQFKNAPTFQLAIDSTFNFQADKALLIWNSSKIGMQKYADCDFLLIDADGMLRKKYLKGTEYNSELVKHIVTLLPMVAKRSSQDQITK